MAASRDHLVAFARSRRRLARRWLDARAAPPTIEAGMAALRDRFDLPGADDDPVFLLGCGWRSGSTLLQRLVVGTGQTFLWGEPYRWADLTGRLADSLRWSATFPRDDELLPTGARPTGAELSDRWLATLSPAPLELIEAHRALFRRLYAEPAAELGFRRWGLKEVRLDVTDALYLRLLFPRASFVFLHRNPYDAWQSFRQNHRGSAYRDGHRVWTARDFGRVWSHLVDDALSRASLVDGLVLRYEDVAHGRALPALEAHLGQPVARDALTVRIGSSRRPSSPTARLGHARLRRAVEPLAGALGYGPGQDG